MKLILYWWKHKLSSCYSDTRPYFKFSSYELHHNHPIGAEHYASNSNVKTVKQIQNTDTKLLNVLDRDKSTVSQDKVSAKKILIFPNIYFTSSITYYAQSIIYFIKRVALK